VLFDITLTVPIDESCSQSEFGYEIAPFALGDETIRGYQEFTIKVSEEVCNCLTPTPTPTLTITPTKTPTVYGTATPSFTPQLPTFTPQPPTRTPTNTPTRTPTNTRTPTPTPLCDQTGVKINMPSHYYRAGDECYCFVTVCNNEGLTLSGYP
jgi:hypothetical protein